MKDFDFGNKSFSDNAGVIVNNKGEMKGIFSFLCNFWFVNFQKKKLPKIKNIDFVIFDIYQRKNRIQFGVEKSGKNFET